MEMDALCESISKSGLLSPIIVRPRDEGGYEIISGHRRFRAYQRLGIEEIPATVCDMTDEEAIVAMVDANLHRDHILPSEKAFAYKMKLDAIKRQGERTDLTSAQLGQRLTSVEKIAAESDESKTQVQRYISLTRLIPELLQMVDEGRIALTPAVELSKLHWQTQKLIYEICDMDDLAPCLKLRRDDIGHTIDLVGALICHAHHPTVLVLLTSHLGSPFDAIAPSGACAGDS